MASQDPLVLMQEMQKRMEAMHTEMATLRPEWDATMRDREAGRRARLNQQSVVPTQTPIVEFPYSYQEGTDQGENSSRSHLARPGNAVRARALHPFVAPTTI
ncbi:hypothetical protein V8G54_003897 [Vigna mungo]|uniref:Uncharacterized protein n=1 Tax=Vigna mungo TaxID=3915 RepID=A0AAQ3SDK0_VIGMU